MKNLHKIRGKREFLFDDRELIVLSTFAMFICGLIFILGFLIGQDMHQNTMASPLPQADMLTTAAANEAITPEQEAIADPAQSEVTSQTQTTKKEKSQEAYYRVLPDKGEFVQTEETPVKTAPDSSAASAAPQPTEKQPTGQTPIAKQEPVSQPPAATPIPAEPNLGTASVLPNVPKSPTDEMRVGRPSYNLEEGAALTGNGYTVQVASSPRQEDAERLLQKFIELGYQAFIKQVDTGEKGIRYRLYVGTFASREEANRLRQDILSKAAHLTKDPYVTKL